MWCRIGGEGRITKKSTRIKWDVVEINWAKNIRHNWLWGTEIGEYEKKMRIAQRG